MSKHLVDRVAPYSANGSVTVEDLHATGVINTFESEAERDDYYATRDLAHGALAQIEEEGLMHTYDATAPAWRRSLRTRRGGPELAIKAVGAKGNGVDDDTDFINEAQAEGGAWGVAGTGRLTWDEGTYVVGAGKHAILSGHNLGDAGARIKPLAGGRVTVTGLLDSQDQFFDYSGGGVVEFWTRQELLKSKFFGVSGNPANDDGPALNRYLDACFGIWHPNFSPSAWTVTTLTKNTESWIPGIYVGARLEVMGGTGAGQYRVITANTATQLTWTGGGAGVGTGDLALDGTSIVRINARHGFWARSFNKPWLLGTGYFKSSVQLNTQLITGAQFGGKGRLATLISITTPNTRLFDLDAANYFRMHHFAVQADAAQDLAHALIEADWTGLYPDTLKVQGQDYEAIYANGNRLAQVGFRIARHGASAVSGNGGTQGDTVTFKDCYRASFLHSGISLGSPEFTPALNVLNVQIKGGDQQDCPKYGVYSNGGQYESTGQGENQGNGGQESNRQIRVRGADFYFDSPNTHVTTIKGYRAESLVLVDGPGAGNVRVMDCQTQDGPEILWGAGQQLQVGQLGRGTSGISKADGLAHIVAMVSGGATTGGTEPDWNSIYGAAVWEPWMQDGGSMTIGRNTVDVPNVGVGLNNQMVMVDNAGALDAQGYPLPVFGYAQYHAAGVDGFGVNHGSAYLTLHTATGGGGVAVNAGRTTADARVRVSPAIVDNNVVWMALDFVAVKMDAGSILDNCRILHGRVDVVGGWPQQITNNTFTRADWFPFRRLNQGGIGDPVNQGSMIWRNQLGWGHWTVLRTPTALASPLVNNPNYPEQNQLLNSGVAMVMPGYVLHPWMQGGLVAPLTGIGRGPYDGAQASLTSTQGRKRNIAAVVGTLGKETVNTGVGADLDIQAGLTKDASGGGKVNIRTQKAVSDADPDTVAAFGPARNANTWDGAQISVGAVLQQVKVGVAGGGVPAGGAVRLLYIDGT